MPFALDARHAPDTLFVVAECDMRFYQKDCSLGGPPWPSELTEALKSEVFQAVHRGVEASRARVSTDAADAAAPDAGRGGRSSGSADGPPGQAAAAAASGAQPGGTSLSPSPTLLDILSTPGSTAKGTSAGRGTAPSPSPASGAPPEQGESSWATKIPRERAREAFLEGLGQEEEDASFFGWTKSPPATAPSQELRDLVRVCTAAHRVGRGNFVWLCWEGNKTNSRSMPSHGTTLVAFTAVFARAFADFLQNQVPGHLDLILLAWLKSEKVQEEVRASFVYPSCGSYEAHGSGCEPSIGVRESSWSSSWVGEGFRSKSTQRFLGAWQKKGGARWLTPALDLDCPSLVWRTERPPTSYCDPRWEWRLWNRGWVDEWNCWVGPKVPGFDPRARRETGAHWWARGRGAPSPSPAAPASASRAPWEGTLEQLRNDPDGYRQLRDGAFAPITRLAEELCTDPLWTDYTQTPGADTRSGRHRRRAMAACLRRCFVDGSQVAAGKKREPAEPLASQLAHDFLCGVLRSGGFESVRETRKYVFV